ncbi:chloride channel protein [Rhodobacterales bacterium]|nr:chloride channel protein [Rhodobacterales bacterium]
MSDQSPSKPPFREAVDALKVAIPASIRLNIREALHQKSHIVWLLALFIGSLVAWAAILFREGIGLVQLFWLGTATERVVSAAAQLPWYVILLAPTLGGLLVGLLLHRIQPMQRTSSVADVIEARVKGGRGLPFWPGISSALITILSLGFGASAGREGPVVHLGATIGTSLGRLFKLPDSAHRILLACGVASAVSASFNAPIAGVLFAHEVVLGHYALSAISPIAISAVTGAVFSRLWFGDVAAFIIPGHQISSYWEFPAFALLGLTCAVVAIIFQFALIGTEWVARNLSLPVWLRPMSGGFLVGAIALVFPDVLGVGYETTDAALRDQLPLTMLLALLVAKTAATAITLASRFGGGIFSPALYLGAMTGGAFGLIAASVFPEMASSEGLYAILGMGGVAAAVLGAPFSTTMIVFELTGGYALSIALLLTVSIATGLMQAVHQKSYFHWQLETRGYFVSEGTHRVLGNTALVRDFMDQPPENPEDRVFKPGEDGPYLHDMDSLESALKSFDSTGMETLPVVRKGNAGEIVGIARHVSALRHFNSALIKATKEEHS